MSLLPPKRGDLHCAGKYFAWREKQPPRWEVSEGLLPPPLPRQMDPVCLRALPCSAEASLVPQTYRFHIPPHLLLLNPTGSDQNLQPGNPPSIQPAPL